MTDGETGSRILPPAHNAANMVLALMHRRPPGRFGHGLLDGLSPFGVLMLVGAEPAVFLIGRAVRGRAFAGRNTNANPLITRSVDPEELDRRIRRHLRSLGILKD